MLIFRKPKLTIFGSYKYIKHAWGLVIKCSSDGMAEEEHKRGRMNPWVQMLNVYMRELTYQNTNAH